MNLEGQFRWVVALRAEAKPLIRKFALHSDASASVSGFPVFRNREENIRLIISGPGKVASAAATAWLAAHSPEGPAAWWNWGIAGAANIKKGEVRIAGRVTDQASQKSWYPQEIWPKKAGLPIAEVITVDQPTDEYPDGKMVEMEASGFLPIAQRFAGAELAHVCKVVSDGPEHNFRELTSEIVEKLCQDALEALQPILYAQEEILAEELVRVSDPELYSLFIERWHFSSSSKVQLRRLLQQAKANQNDQVSAILAEELTNGRAVIARLREVLWS